MRPLLLILALALGGCAEKTGAITPEQQQRLDAEGIVRRADDQVFRYTHGSGTREAGWEERRASIIVTKQSVIIHKNQKMGLEINAAHPALRPGPAGRQPGADQRGGRPVGGELVVRPARRRAGLGRRHQGGGEGGEGAGAVNP